MSERALKLIAENKRTRATFLDLGNCGLTEIPDEIGELVWLEVLSFSEYYERDDEWLETKNTGESNQLSDLTPLSGLSALQKLYVFHTKVSDLTPLSNLRALQLLNVAKTQVSDLTPLSNLSALQLLNVANTQVSDLTPLSSLRALQLLNVAKTQVSDLTPLSSLRALQLLNVAKTQVSDLSPVLSLIENGLPVKWARWEKGICVQDCPLTHPPEATVKQGNEAILNYFREIQLQGTDYLYEAKLLLVGAGSVRVKPV